MIEFKGVRFRYDNEGPEALQGVDLEIPDGIFSAVSAPRSWSPVRWRTRTFATSAAATRG